MTPFFIIVSILTICAISKCDDTATGTTSTSSSSSRLLVSSANTGLDEASSLPMLASGKRQHNIMRFGKRPAGGHNLIHFGKREGPQHRYMFMGKRDEEESEDGPVFPFLQRDDNSYKRGHTIMRFGKRAPPQGSHNFIRFGKREDEDEEEEKRATGHSMMYFGKRGGHNMMYFGKRGTNGHSMMYFGKRNDDYDPDLVVVPVDDAEKRAHSMIHFGKREEEEESKRGGGSHSMIHFGKRLEDQEESNDSQLPLFWTPEMAEKRSFLKFGKKTEGSRARGSHAMIHFGKRSVNQSDSEVTRTKRQADELDEEPESVIPLYYPRPQAWEDDSNYMEYGEPMKKDGSKNVFLRFG